MDRTAVTRLSFRRQSAIALAVSIAAVASQRASAVFSFTKVVDVNTQAPSENLGFTYRTFGRPAINSSYITYRAATTSPNFGIRAVDRASPANVLTRIHKLDPSIGTQTILTDPSTSLSDVAFKVVPPSGGSQPNEYFTTGNTLNFAAIGAGAPQIYDGNVVFTRFGAGAAAKNINLVGFNATDNNAATFAGVAVDGLDLVPGGGGATFSSFGDYLDHNITKNPLNQKGSIAFEGFWSPFAADAGIYRWDQATDTITRVADKNVAIPGLGGTFNSPAALARTHVENQTSIGHPGLPVDERTCRPSIAGQIVGFSYDDLATKSGAYLHYNGSVHTIADTNTPHPSLGGTFGRFHEISTVGSATAFIATGDSGASLGGEVGMSGLYLNLCGNNIEVIKEGDILNGRDVTNVQISHRGLGLAAGNSLFAYLELTFRVNFADINYPEAIYKTSTPLLCYAVATGFANGNATGTSLVTTPIGSTTFETPVFDVNDRLRVQMHATQGNGVDAIFSGDLEADLYGVDGAPGNNTALIDFTRSAAGAIVPEAMSTTFNQPVLLESLQLMDFGPNDSALIDIAGTSMIVSGANYPDGMIPLNHLFLNEGDVLKVAWDGTNGGGDGFSFNGIGFIAVPEPVLATSLIGFALIRRRRACAR